jgi:virginiamycin A acetyltransferase
MDILRKYLNRIVSTKSRKKTIPKNMTLGRGSYYGSGCTFIAHDGGKIQIGNYCSIANDVSFINVNHNYQSVSTYPFSVLHCNNKESRDRIVGNIVLENDVWIGNKAIILKDTTIGNGAIVAAGSVVTKSIPPYAIAGGNPAKILKFRFRDQEIESLLKICWWNWEEELILNRIDDFYLPIDQFIEKYA